MSLFGLSVSCLAVLVAFHFTIRSVHRLYFHPLSHVPGPRLAAISRKWIAYYDLVHFGRLLFKIEELHKRYGPVVRVGPDEVHVFDIDSYRKIFRNNTSFNVDTYIHQNAIFRGSLLSTSRLQDAKPRRDTYLPFFSKQAIRKLEPVLEDIVDRLFVNLDQHLDDQHSVNLTLGFKCFALEVITRYCFAESADAVSAAYFRHPVVEAFLKSPRVHRPKQHFPRLWSIVELLQRRVPVALLRRIDPNIPKAMVFLRNQHTHIKRMMENNIYSQASVANNVFDSVIRPQTKTRAPQLTVRQLQSEAGFFIAAGMDTTSHVLEVGIWGLLTRPAAMKRLVQELQDAIPSMSAVIHTNDVERLPYLSAVVKESLRLAHGIPGRLLRIVPPGGHSVAGYHVPAGTSVGHSVYLYHTDDSVFKAARAFLPERWLESHSAELEAHLLSFSRGSRSCLGINLAYAELYLTFARLLRRYHVTNAGTTDEDMEWRDFFVPYLNGSLKVFLTKREA